MSPSRILLPPAETACSIRSAAATAGRPDRQSNSACPSASATANSWTFPVLLKWRILPGPIQPFAGAGPVFDYVSGVNVHPGTLGFHVGGGSVTRGGGTIAGGVEVHAGRVLLSPELRYSRYSAESLGANLGNLFTFNQNQATFLPGISFGGRR